MYLKTMLENNASPMKSQIETLCDVLELLEKKLKDNYEKYASAELAMTVVKQDGNVIERSSPFCQEYRATMRDYEQGLRQLQILLQDKITEEQVGTLNDLRSKFKITIG